MVSVAVLLVYFAFYLWPVFLTVGALLMYVAYRYRDCATSTGKLIAIVCCALLGIFIFALGLYGML